MPIEWNEKISIKSEQSAKAPKIIATQKIVEPVNKKILNCTLRPLLFHNPATKTK